MLCLSWSRIENGGRGVYVTTNVEEGNIIGFYDAYEAEDTMSDQDHEYGIESGGKCYVGFSTPRIEGGIGQFINDGSIPRIPISLLSLPYEEKIRELCHIFLRYSQESLAKENVIVREDMLVQSTRNIEAGEECYFSYCILYWIDWYKRRVDSLAGILGIFREIYLLETKKQGIPDYDRVKALINILNYDKEDYLPCSLSWRKESYRTRAQRAEDEL